MEQLPFYEIESFRGWWCGSTDKALDPEFCQYCPPQKKQSSRARLLFYQYGVN
jgi:hypothetical protein